LEWLVYTDVKLYCIQSGVGFWFTARSRRGRRSDTMPTEQPTQQGGKRTSATMR
jgi:hypothetical protein